MKTNDDKKSQTVPKNRLGFLLLTQIHFSRYKEFVFAFYGGLEEIRLHFYFVKINVSLGQALASNAHPRCI